jgi:hypothetical protein
MAQGVLPFKYEAAESRSGMTALAGLPTYLDLAAVAGLGASIEKHVKVRTGEQGWTDRQIVTSLILLNLAGGDCVDDLARLESDDGFAEVMRRVETHGMPRCERRALLRRFRKGQKRSVPSQSTVFRYLAEFHDQREEVKREPHKAFIPAPNEHCKRLFWTVLPSSSGHLKKLRLSYLRRSSYRMNESLALTIETPVEIEAVPLTDADASDEQLIALWLHERSRHTVRAYRRDVDRLRAFVGKPLRAVTLGDLQAFSDTLTGEGSSRGRVIASCKSLLSFGSKIGALAFNVGAALRKPPARDTLADRILEEGDVAKMLALTEGSEHVLIQRFRF